MADNRSLADTRRWQLRQDRQATKAEERAALSSFEGKWGFLGTRHMNQVPNRVRAYPENLSHASLAGFEGLATSTGSLHSSASVSSTTDWPQPQRKPRKNELVR